MKMKKNFLLAALMLFLVSGIATAIPFPWGPMPFPPQGLTAEIQTRDAVVHVEPKCISRSLVVLHEGDVVILTGRFERGYLEVMAIVSDHDATTTVIGWISGHTIMESAFELPRGVGVGSGQLDRTETCFGTRG